MVGHTITRDLDNRKTHLRFCEDTVKINLLVLNLLKGQHGICATKPETI